MKQYPVKITDRALSDMEAIYNYIASELAAPDTALRQYNRIAEGIASLSQFPNRCALLESQPERDFGMRLLLVDNFSVIYVAEDTAMTVLRVLYSASDILSRLRNG